MKLPNAAQVLLLLWRAHRGCVTSRRELAWRFLRDSADTISFERDGIHWTTDTFGLVAHDLFLHGSFQQNDVDFVLGWLSQNKAWNGAKAIISVGANIGDTAIPLAKLSGKRVVACEPMSKTFAILRQNVEANALASLISCRKLAIGTKRGAIRVVNPGNSGQAEVWTENGTYGFGQFKDSFQVCEADMVSLADLVEREQLAPAEIGFVWSDTQGFESDVIESGGSLWAASVPLWVEIWPQGLERHGGCRRFIDLCCHHFKFITHKGIRSDISYLPKLIDQIGFGLDDYTDAMLHH